MAVVYTGGCTFRCPFCYNRDLVLNPESLPSFSEQEVLGLLSERKQWLDGVAISGGEPTIWADLPEFMARVKELGACVMLETNGTNPEMMSELFGQKLVDYVAMDVKAPLDWEKYSVLAGIKERSLFEKVLESIGLIKNSGVDYEFRTTLAPNLLTVEDVIAIAERLEGAKRYVVQQFIPKSTIDAKLEKAKPVSTTEIERLREKLGGKFREFKIRNV